jgi:NAD(P)-dependent dehydrogenase (short-subunit alcohol dehydrogenase family)
VVGTALGVVATAGLALLLYTGGGFLRAAGFLAGLTFAAAGIGVWAGDPERVPSRPRLRWVLTSMAFVAAGGFAVVWSLSESLRASAMGASLGALFILAEPAYAAGALLAMLAGRRKQAPLALTGIATGIVLAATFAIPRLDASIVFFAAAAATIAAGLLPAGRTRDEDDMTVDIRDYTAIVTGVSERGQVGFAIAQRLLREGARVLITARRDSVRQLAEELAALGDVAAVEADLTREEDVERLVAEARSRFGRLDALINVAGGLSVMAPLAETAVDEWNRELQRNAETVLRVTNAALPLLRESGGAVINFASPAGLRAVRRLGAYSAAKAAVVAMTRALALEELANGVRVNAIAPGMIDTAQNRAEADDPDAAKFVTREEIADVVVFLASDAASGISGETIRVMGEGLR